MIQAKDDYPIEYENTLWEFSLGMWIEWDLVLSSDSVIVTSTYQLPLVSLLSANLQFMD
jgi:hypothetical protein